MKLRRSNHFLPVCYQKGFADSSGRVWVKFARQRYPVLLGPAAVGKKHNLYIRRRAGIERDDVEDFFSKEVEGPFAAFSQRVVAEQSNLSRISGAEAGALARFVASQAVRTLAHKQCVEEQAGGRVDSNAFVQVVLGQMSAIVNQWLSSAPTFHFYTPLPYVEERFITGDHPVLVMHSHDNPIWVTTDAPQPRIVSLVEILGSQRYAFVVSLSPYVCVSIQGQGDGACHLPPETLGPRDVRAFNGHVRGQSELFALARDRESLI